MRRYSIIACMFIIIISYSQNIQAKCMIMSDAKTIYFPAVTLSASEKGTVNTILYRYSLPMNGLSYTCGQAIVSTWKSEFLRPEFNSTNIQNTYTTGIPGIGIRVKWPESRGQNAWIPGSYSCTGYCMEQPDNIIIEFIQTGTIKSGILQAGELAKISLFANNNPQDSILMMNINIGQVDVNVRSCSIYASNNSINLGDYVLTDVKKNGFQGEMKDFSITLDCPERSSAKIQFDGTNPWGMSGGTLVSNGTAKYAYTRLYSKLGNRYKELTLNSLISFGSVASFTGSRQVEYAAQMYFDDSNRSAVTAGNVNSNVVYTLSID